MGYDAIARTAPSRGSSAMIAPPATLNCLLAFASAMPSRIACSAARCTRMSIVSRTAMPGRASRLISSGLCGRPRESTRICAAPEVPLRYSSNVASTPDLPILSPPR